MIDRDRIEAALLAWMGRAAGCQAVMAEQGGAAPVEPYVTLKLKGPRYQGQAMRSMAPSEDDGFVFKYRQNSELTAELRAFTSVPSGNSCAQALLERLLRSMDLMETRALLEAEGLVVRKRGDLVDLNEPIGREWHGRAVVDVIFGISDVVEEKVDSIERAEVSGSVES